MQPERKEAALAVVASACLLLLSALCLAWEMSVAPLRPGGSWLALKALPLLLPMPGVMQRRRYSFQWASLLVLVYFGEGLVRSMAEQGVSRMMAIAEAALALAFYLMALAYVRLTRQVPPAPSASRNGE